MRTFSNGYWVNERDFELRFIITGRPAVLKNRKQIVFRARERPILTANPRAKKWHKDAVHQLAPQWPLSNPIPIDVPVWVQIQTWAHDRRRRDLDNSLSGPLDAMVVAKRSVLGKLVKPGAGILTDDCQVKSLDGSRLLYDSQNPRVEITLRPYKEEP